jgi:HPr kinase/phosphorylase
MKAEDMRRSVSVSTFLETGRDICRLDIAAGKQALDRRIREAAIHRPGLALTGFYNYFPQDRVQVIGLAEDRYLASLSGQQRRERLQRFFRRKIPCVVVARNRRLIPEISPLAEAHKVPVLKSRMITKHFINAATIVMENLMAPRLKVQGTMVEIMGIGVLIEGKPGMGKSETALELIRNGSALVSDDLTEFRLDSSGAIVGAPVNVTRYHMEIKGLGIIHVPSLFGVAAIREAKRLDLVASLCRPDSKEIAESGDSSSGIFRLFDRDIPRVHIPVAPGRNLANIIRTAALDQKLRRLGHDAAKELDERLISIMSREPYASE